MGLSLRENDIFFDVPSILKEEEGLFEAKYMVSFDGTTEEGPYNDAYLYSYAKHGLLKKNTLVRKLGEASKQKAGDNEDIKQIFYYLDCVSHPLHVKWDDKLPAYLVQSFIVYADLFKDPHDPDRIDRKILKRIDMYQNDMDLYDEDVFSSDIEQMARENLTDAERKTIHKLIKKVDNYLKTNH